jgi:hypothetical protein
MLLTNYGFAILNNKYDYCRVKFPLHALLTPAQFTKVASFFDNTLFVDFKFKASCVNIKFISLLRGVYWEPKMGADAFFAPKSRELEEKVLKLAEFMLNEQLEEFETTVEEDQRILEQPKNSRHYFAVSIKQIVYRMGLKNALISQINLLRICQRLVDLQLSYRELVLTELTDGIYYAEIEENWEGVEEYAKKL